MSALKRGTFPDNPEPGGTPPPLNPRRFWGGLVTIFLALTAAIGLTGYYYARHQTSMQLQSAKNELSSIADLKVGQISNWYTDRLVDAKTILANPLAQQEIARFLAEPSPSPAGRTLAEWFQVQAELKHCQVFLFDAQGTARLSAPPNSPVPDVSRHPDFLAALRGGDVVVTDLHRDAADAAGAAQDIHLSFWIPVGRAPGPGTSATGVLLLRIDPYQLLYPLVQSWPTTSPTAETLLVRRDGDSVVYLNELRHKKGTALALTFSAKDNPHLPATLAVQGHEGTVESLDYRLVPVLAAMRAIPGTPWYMVAKTDLEEVRAPMRRQVWSTSVILVALVLAAALGAGFLGRRRDNQWLRQQLAVEHERQALAERYVLLNKHANDIILLTDQDGTVLEANDRALAAYGRPLDEMKQLTLRELRSVEGNAEPERDAHEAAPHDGAMMEADHRRRDGSTFPVEISTHAMAIGGVTYHQSIIRDITERKKVANDLARLNQELGRKNQELEQVVYVASHDLRSPLVNVQGFSTELGLALDELRTLLGDVSLPGETRKRLDVLLVEELPESLGYILSGVSKMDMLIAGLLRLSRLGRVAISVGPVDMNKLAAEMARTFEFQVKEAGVALSIGELPPCLGDAAMLNQAFSNLLNNALKYLDPARPGVVRITGTRENGLSVYCVEDNGIGISDRHQIKVFELYHRLNPGDSAGEGLGLTIVRTVLDRQHGRVWLESTPGAGTRFYVSLPGAGETGKDGA